MSASDPLQERDEPAQVAPTDERPAHGSGSMYGWLWRHLPGEWPWRVVILAVGLVVVVVVLFGLVFPWIEPRLPFNHVTVGGGG